MAAQDNTKLVLTIEYDGTRYSGSQCQRHGLTVQNELEVAIEKLTGEKLRAHLASRTDAGVSALGQVVSFRAETGLSLDKVLNGLNHYLPDDIAVQAAYRTSDSLDIRRHAISREYLYRIWNYPTPSPLKERHSYRVAGELDAGLMNMAANLLVGSHNLAAFASRLAKKAQSTRTVRTVHEASVSRDGREIFFRIVAVSFLPHQVRNTVGSLIKVGRGKMTIEEFKALMASVVLGSAGPAAPGRGLCLVRVNYLKDLGDYDENL